MTPTELADILCAKINVAITAAEPRSNLEEPTIYNAKCNLTYPHDLFHTKATMVLKDRKGKEFVISVRRK